MTYSSKFLLKQVYQDSHKLAKINLETNSIERIYPFEGIASTESYINDVRVDIEKQVAYLTNSNEGGIVILNLETGEGRQVLQGRYSVNQFYFCYRRARTDEKASLLKCSATVSLCRRMGVAVLQAAYR